MTVTSDVTAALPPLTGSDVLDPWRVRYRNSLLGKLPELPRQHRGRTKSEAMLWEALDARNEGWREEYATGRYRLDFYLPAAQLAVEVDGGSHRGHLAREHDDERDLWHWGQGIETLRINARHVEIDLLGVLHCITERVLARTAADAGVPGAVREAANVREEMPAYEWVLTADGVVHLTVLPDIPSPSSVKAWVRKLLAHAGITWRDTGAAVDGDFGRALDGEIQG
jgi:very-short-patch-repair endonuclease